MKTPIGIVDDHQLFLKSVSLMLAGFDNFKVVLEALNGKDLQEKMKEQKILPQIILLDINMPVMDGIETASWLNKNYPSIKVVALSMNDNDKIIVTMLKAGCCAYLLKDTHPDELEKALEEIRSRGYYNADATNINYRRLLFSDEQQDFFDINSHERKFLELVCTDLTYKNIADKLKLSERAVDGYREMFFKKFRVQSRVGLALEAIRRNLVKL